LRRIFLIVKKNRARGFFYEKQKIINPVKKTSIQPRKPPRRFTPQKMDSATELETVVNPEVAKSSPKKRERKHYMLMYRLEARIESMTQKLNKLIALRPIKQ
jgi:hypothetical protein